MDLNINTRMTYISKKKLDMIISHLCPSKSKLMKGLGFIVRK